MNAAGLDGYVLESKYDFDYNKGLWWQIWNTDWTFEEYYRYINEPKHLVNPVRNLRLFESDFMELTTMAPWFLIPLIWIPVVSLYIYNSEGTNKELTTWYCVGLLSWTFLEYALHRFFFHMEDQFYFIKHPKFQAIHFMVHGVHHAFPCDAYRLVFPPVLGFIVWFLIVNPVLRFFYPA